MSTLNKFLYESPDGMKYYFDGRITSHTNTGLPPVKFIEDFGPNQNGSTVRDWRINPRKIALDIFLQGGYCCGTRGEQLAEIINVIRPNRGQYNNSNGWLRFINDSQIMMEIPSYILQGPSGDYSYNDDIGKYQVSDGVIFYASDPIWREKDALNYTFTLEGVGSCLDVGCLQGITEIVEGDFCLGARSFFNIDVDIYYGGTWDGDQIDIRMVGPLTNPVIKNVTLDKTIELEYTIPSGNFVDIIIRPEFTTVQDNQGNNLIGSITSISDLVDFTIKSQGEITPTGKNTIRVTSTGADENSSIGINYWTRHISAYGMPQCITPPEDEGLAIPNEDLEFTVDIAEFEPSIVLLADAPLPRWTVVENNSSTYIYNTTSFTHFRSFPGEMTVTLNREVLPYVDELNLSEQGVKGYIDVSGIYNVTKLQITDGGLTSIVGTGNLLSLTELRLWGNSLKSIEPVDNLINLNILDVSNNNILETIGNVSDLDELIALYLNGNDLKSIGSVNKMPNMLDLRLYDNPSLTTLVTLDELGAGLYALYLYNTICTVLPGTNPVAFTGIIEIVIDDINITESEIDAILDRLWQDRNLFTTGGAGHSFRSVGTNDAPSGIYQAANPPTTGKEFVYELANDSNGEGFQTWTMLVSASP